ncbi:MFS transporter [Nonomuraea sp. NPDC050663]|uniref:MFS transporter n=1 Tax=Nonomuraea sp. NPDC050663 TaxID=3364370 RepID=UPI00378E75A2
MRELLRDRRFLLLFVGQTVNMIGDRALLVVLGIFVKELTGSDTMAGVVFILLSVPSFFAPLTGLLVDRFPRRKVLIVNDLLAGALVLCLLLVRDPGDLWIVFAVTLGYGFANAIFAAARGGLIHSMVPERLLGDANGLLSSLGQGLRVLGPLIGAALYVALGLAAVAVLDTLTFLISVLVLLMLRRVPDLATPARREPGTFRADLLAGVRHLMGDRELRAGVLAVAAALSAAGLVNAAMFAAVEQGLGRPAAFVGVIAAFQGAGSVAGGFAVAPLIRRYGEHRAAAVGFVLSAAGLALVIPATEVTMCAGGVLVGLSIPIFMVATTTLVQRRTEAGMQGRALTAMDAIIDLPFVLSMGAGTLVVAILDFRVIYAVAAVIFAVVAASVLVRRDWRIDATLTPVD